MLKQPPCGVAKDFLKMGIGIPEDMTRPLDLAK
jgi:hypothetical protein